MSYDLEDLERRRSHALDLAAAVVIILGILGLFLFDISQPRGVLDGVGYAAMVALSVRFGERLLIACAVTTTGLTLAAAFLVPDRGISVLGMWGNHALAIVSIWIVAGILLRRLRLEAYIISRENRLQNHQNALSTIIREALLADKPLQKRIECINELAAKAMQSDLAGVFESGHDTKTVRTVNLWDRQKQRHSIVHGIPVNENPEFQEAIEREFVVYADDVLVSPAHRNRLGVLEPLGIRAILIADTFSQQPGIGYVGFAFRQPHHWTRQEIAFARGVANLVALLFASNQNAETLATLDQVSEAIYAEDRFGALQYANRAARALHGAAPEQNRFPRPDNPLAGESDVQEIQHEGRDLEIRRLRLPNAGVLTRISDVTARNAVATTRLQYEARLQQSVKMEAIGQLAGGIAHDFNNILGSILGFAGFLVQDLPERSAEHGFAERILSACERGKGLIEQILAFASASAVERGAVELDALLKRNQKNLTGLLPERVRLSISLPEVPLPILGSATQIGQLVANLCNNACDAFGDGSGTINIAARPISSSEVESLKTPVRASHERQFGEMQEGRSYCLLEVEDDGPGIAPDILDRVFEPFFTTKGRHRSAGLGLAVVHGVVVSTGGVCRLTSIPGKRTVFSIYFPLASEAIVEKHHRNQSAIPRGGERVLIVDDEPDIADMLAIGLERLGYRAVGVNDPLEALAAFEEDPEAFDAVVTDQVMPGLRGLDLIQRLKEIRPEIKAILCTGYSDGANEDVSRAAGADAYFHKPVEATQIARQIRILADRKN